MIVVFNHGRTGSNGRVFRILPIVPVLPDQPPRTVRVVRVPRRRYYIIIRRVTPPPVLSKRRSNKTSVAVRPPTLRMRRVPLVSVLPARRSKNGNIRRIQPVIPILNYLR